MIADENYYKGLSSGAINCKDGSKKFTKAQLNDDFCDCPDGSDEPGLCVFSLLFSSFLLARLCFAKLCIYGAFLGGGGKVCVHFSLPRPTIILSMLLLVHCNH